MYNKQMNFTRYTKGWPGCPCCNSYLRGRRNKLNMKYWNDDNALFKEKE